MGFTGFMGSCCRPSDSGNWRSGAKAAGRRCTFTERTEFWHNEVPGVKVPDRIRQIMSDAPPDRAAPIGLELALDFAAHVRTVRAAGLYVMPPLGRYEMVEKIVEAVGER